MRASSAGPGAISAGVLRGGVCATSVVQPRPRHPELPRRLRQQTRLG